MNPQEFITKSIRYVKRHVYKLIRSTDSVESWIKKYFRNKNILLVQIGSNDGKTGDPLFKLIKENKLWRAIFVEPIPYLFDRLKNNYGPDSRFSFENAAINQGRRQIFYSVSEDANRHLPDLPFWYDQLGSFSRANITNHLNGILEPYIRETELTGLTLEQLFQKHQVNKIDLLHVDTEGYDAIVILQLDLEKHQPTMIIFEHKQLSHDAKIDCINMLKEYYYLFQFEGDFLCILKNKINKTDLNKLEKKHALSANVFS